VRVRCTGRKGCGIYASLAIYVLRHTSSPALAPIAHHPLCLSDLPATSRDHPPSYTSDPSFRPPPSTVRQRRAVARRGTSAPCHHPRIDGPTRDRFAVPSAPVAATTGRGCTRDTLRRSIVIQFQAPPDTFFRLVPARSTDRSSGSPKKCLCYSGEHFRFYGRLCCSMSVMSRHAIRCERCFKPDGVARSFSNRDSIGKCSSVLRRKD